MLIVYGNGRCPQFQRKSKFTYYLTVVKVYCSDLYYELMFVEKEIALSGRNLPARLTWISFCSLLRENVPLYIFYLVCCSNYVIQKGKRITSLIPVDRERWNTNEGAHSFIPASSLDVYGLSIPTAMPSPPHLTTRRFLQLAGRLRLQ